MDGHRAMSGHLISERFLSLISINTLTPIFIWPVFLKIQVVLCPFSFFIIIQALLLTYIYITFLLDGKYFTLYEDMTKQNMFN